MNPLRIAWVPPHGTIDRASYRLECWYPHLWLSEHGFSSTVLTEFPTKADKDKYDFLIWFRTDHPEQAFNSGIPVIYFLTDGPMPKDEQLEQAYWLVTDCHYVVEQLMHRDEVAARESGRQMVSGKLTHIPDTFDPPNVEDLLRMQVPKAQRTIPKLVWVGSQGGYPWAKETIDFLRQTWEVEVISDHAESTKVWKRETIFGDLLDCDIGIIPYPTGLHFGNTNGFQPLAKDINRVVLMQAAGLPVIAAPLPAYLAYIRNGVDGMIADGPEEMYASVLTLSLNPEAARTMANLGKLRAWTTASPPFTGNRWRLLLNKLSHQ